MSEAMRNIPQVLVTEAENKAADWQFAGALADRGWPPRDWNPKHPREFGVFRIGRNDYCVAPLFPHVLADKSMTCLYRTDTGAI